MVRNCRLERELVGECLQTKVRGCADMRLIQEHKVAGTCNKIFEESQLRNKR